MIYLIILHRFLESPSQSPGQDTHKKTSPGHKKNEQRLNDSEEKSTVASAHVQTTCGTCLTLLTMPSMPESVKRPMPETNSRPTYRG